MTIVHFKKTGIWSIAIGDSQFVNLIPGVNEIIEPEWNKLKEIKEVQEKIDEGVLVIVSEPKPGKKTEQGLPKELTPMIAGDAIDLVSGIVDLDVLKAWEKKEKRNTVIKAIKDQIKTVKDLETDND
jgi:hypothetical protein